jgi:hypothetical protein
MEQMTRLPASSPPGRTLALLFSVLMPAYYLLLNNGLQSEGLFAPVYIGLTFNNMLEHLLNGGFDIDADVIGNEAFVRDGKTYAYFGVIPALLRLPLVAIGQLHSLDVTRLYCAIAATLAGFFKIRTVMAATSKIDDVPLRQYGCLALLIASFLGSPEVQMSRALVYQEAVLWAGAIASAFIYCAVLGLVVRQRFSTGLLAAMAFLAGTTLLTRVSTAIGLYAAMGFLALTLAMISSPAGKPTLLARLGAASRTLMEPRFLVSFAVLGGFVMAAGYVNYARWGNPLTTLPIHLHVTYSTYDPIKGQLIEKYGAFNLGRIWFGILYYFLPIWAWVRADKKFLFHEYQEEVFTSVELPPSSFLISDTLLAVLAFLFFRSLAVTSDRNSGLGRWQAGACILGLAIPGFLMLGWETLSFRYRAEFYPALTLAAVLGFRAACAPESGTLRHSKTVGQNLLWLAYGGIVVSHLLYFVYQLTPFGPARYVNEVGYLRAYYWQLFKPVIGMNW